MAKKAKAKAKVKAKAKKAAPANADLETLQGQIDGLTARMEHLEAEVAVLKDKSDGKAPPEEATGMVPEDPPPA